MGTVCYVAGQVGIKLSQGSRVNVVRIPNSGVRTNLGRNLSISGPLGIINSKQVDGQIEVSRREAGKGKIHHILGLDNGQPTTIR